MTDQIKLDFTYDNTENCEIAFHNGYRIRAVRDEHPSNPFTDGDCNWPIVVRSPDSFRGLQCYTAGEEDGDSLNPLTYASDGMLIHMQVHIAKALDTTVLAMCDEASWDEPVAYCLEADCLRDLFDTALGNLEDRELLEAYHAILTLIGVPSHLGTTRGYSQGDEAEVLVYAPPSEVERLNPGSPPTAEQLEYAVDLYGAWAWGDVYGYVIEQPAEVDEDGDVIEWEEVESGSCWGYYGTDHDESGLAEAALECVPDEAPTMPEYQGEQELEDA